MMWGVNLVVLSVLGLTLAQSYNPEAYCFAGPDVYNNEKAGFTLSKIQLLTRHGDRTPVNVMPVARLNTVEWNCSLNLLNSQIDLSKEQTAPKRRFRKNYIQGREILPGNCYFGQLTNVGASQHNSFGGNFRKLYVDTLNFLPATLDPSKMYVRSTDVERTILSAYNFLNGLYPQSDVDTLLTLNTIDGDRDDAIGNNPSLCPRVGKILHEIYNSTEYYDQYNVKLLPLAKKYSAIWNMTLTPRMMGQINDVIRSRYCHQQPMPEPMTLEDAELLMQGDGYMSNWVQNHQDVLKYTDYTFVKTMLDVFQDASSVPFHYYSAHDSTMRDFMLTLHAFDDNSPWPPLASHAVLELWNEESTGNQFVALQYDGKPVVMKPPCSAEFCPLSTFQELVESYKFDPAECFE